MKGLSLDFYKGTGGKWGAAQFSPMPAHMACPKCKLRSDILIFGKKCTSCSTEMKASKGVIFLDITSTKSKDVYDWENKTVLALNSTDLGKILTVLDGQAPEAKIMHDPGAKTSNQGAVQKWLTVSSPKGITAGCLLSSSEKKKNEQQPIRHIVPLTADELKVLETHIRSFIPKMSGW